MYHDHAYTMDCKQFMGRATWDFLGFPTILATFTLDKVLGTFWPLKIPQNFLKVLDCAPKGILGFLRIS